MPFAYDLPLRHVSGRRPSRLSEPQAVPRRRPQGCQNRAIRPNPRFASDDLAVVRELIRDNPWATIVTGRERGPVASHYPILLDEDSAELAIISHVGRPDDQVHDLGAHELLVIVQGRNGYISPRWYAQEGARLPTWNFTVAHLYGMPEILGEEQNLHELARLVARFERRYEDPVLLDLESAAEIATGTVGYRLRVTRFICKVKLSQDKDVSSRRRVIEGLRQLGPYRHPALADEMERVLFGE